MYDVSLDMLPWYDLDNERCMCDKGTPKAPDDLKSWPQIEPHGGAVGVGCGYAACAQWMGARRHYGVPWANNQAGLCTCLHMHCSMARHSLR